MKSYPAHLLDAWPGDQGSAALPASPRAQALFPRFHAEAGKALTWIAETVKAVKEQEDTVFDQLYRRGHVLSGMAALLGLPKAEHLLAALDFGLDLARMLQTFENRSLGYVVNMLVTTTRGVLDDFQASSRSARDLADVIEECRTYLGEPLRQSQLPEEKVTAPPAPVEAPPAPPPAAPVPAPVVVAVHEEVEDGPEELEIPADKIGLISDFCEEARESLGQVGRRLIDLEGTAEPLPIVNDLFRSVHTVKGGARLLKVRKMEALAHRMESMLDEVRKGRRSVSAGMIDVLLAGKNLLEEMVDEVASHGPLHTRIAPWLASLTALEAGTNGSAAVAVAPLPEKSAPARPAETAPPAPPPPAAKPSGASASTDSIRIPIEKLDEVLNTASEVFISRIRLANDVAAVNTAVRNFKQTLRRLEELGLGTVLDRLAESNRRLTSELRALFGGRGSQVPTEKIQSLVGRFHRELSADVEERGFSAPEELTLSLLSIDEVRKRLQKNVEHMEQLSVRLQSGAMSFRMVPIATLFDRFPTQVREMGRQMGKKVRLEVSGGDTELDKVMIHQLTDPLMHILRNSIDHGIEMPEVRAAQGKPEVGHVLLRAYYHGSHAVIEVRDDGRGIDADRVLAKAIENGLVDREKAPTLTKSEIFELIFEPGLSTAAKVSTLSGRGVGMDVVKTAIGQLQGSIVIESALGTGTLLRMKLPLTLAVVGIVLVREQAFQFAFPIQYVEEVLDIGRDELRQFSANTIYNYRGATLPVTTLSTLLGFPPSSFADTVSLVVLAEGEKKVGVLVDAVLGRQEVLIKNLGRLIKKAPFVMGCTILSDSRLVLILNAWEIVNARANAPVVLPPVPREQEARKQHAILVVDDSAIQRNRLSAIIRRAGYTVVTAENGFEGLKRLRERRFSAFSVDAIMPLMDGFEFVERLRGVPDHRDSPVFFITGRASQQGQERAAKLGALEYFVKPVAAEELVQALDRACMKKKVSG